MPPASATKPLSLVIRAALWSVVFGACSKT
jgi:hypothetical protein